MSDEALNLTATQRAIAKLANREEGLLGPRRTGPRARVRLTCIPEMVAIPGGLRATKGEQELVVYAEDIEEIREKLVEPHPEWIDDAKRYVEEAQAKHRAERPRMGKDDPMDDYGGPRTWSAAFRMQHLRQPKPLTKLEVLEDLPPAESAEDRMETLATERIARIVAEVLKQSNDRPESSGRRGK